MADQKTVYDAGFYENQSDGSLSAAQAILARVNAVYPFNSMLDVGCGVGTWLKAAQTNGVDRIFGVDGDYVQRDMLQIPPENFKGADLTLPMDLGEKFDLTLSVEVAEHIEAADVRNYMSILTKHSDAILFSAAVPGQGGTHHVNENWAEYWEKVFDDFGFEPVDFLRELIWADTGIPFWYRQNICFFRRKSAAKKILPDHATTPFQSRIHPEFYLKKVAPQKVRPDRRYYRTGIAERAIEDTPRYRSKDVKN